MVVERPLNRRSHTKVPKANLKPLFVGVVRRALLQESYRIPSG